MTAAQSVCRLSSLPLHSVLFSAVLLLTPGSGASAQADTVQSGRSPHTTGAPTSYTPHRVYDVARGAFVDFETLAARAAGYDVVFFGERHGHTPTHRMQHALLEALARRGGATLSMEMFERDVADIVAGYAAGEVEHSAFIAESRPWPRFFSDYHALVEEARNRNWQVIAANVPREIAAFVAREGLDALDELEPARRAAAAAELHCPDDAYRARFVEEMNRHPVATGEYDDAAELRNQRYYESQCLKDETMAEAIFEALQRGATRPIVHVTGAFHSDHGDGIPVRLRRRSPDVTILTLTSVPVTDLDTADPSPHVRRADYLLFTLSTESAPR
jgi:uncharacterized iron-regulated protein